MTDAPQLELGAGDWRQAGTLRATLYGWFASLYARELPAAELAAWQAGKVAPLLQGLDALGLAAQAARMTQALAGLRDVPDAALELAADFAQVFLLDERRGALPYASCYKGDAAQFCGPAEQRMQAFLAQSSLALHEDFREPADHLAVCLAVMVKLIETPDAQPMAPAVQALDQLAFLREGLMTWLPAFTEKCQQVMTRFDVYPALAALLLGFVQQDLLFLQDVAGAWERPQ